MAEASCGNCWWREGNRCYQGNPDRGPDGRSLKLADAVCPHHDPRTTQIRIAEALGLRASRARKEEQ